MGANCNHSHAVKSGISSVKIGGVTLLNFLITVAEVIGGLISGSLSLLSDALHNLSDTIAIAMSWVAIKISRKPASERKSFGYERAEIITAFVNSTSLGGICIYLVYEGINRFFNPGEIDGMLMLVVASIGLLGNLFSIIILKKDSESSINLKSSYLHLLGDTLSSVGVVIGALLIWFKGVYWIDPLITVLVAVYIFKENWGVIKKSADILMQSAADIDYISLREDLLAVEGVEGVHHMHTWQTNEGNTYLESHICTEDMMVSGTSVISEKIKSILLDKYNIRHVTLQFELKDECFTPLKSCADLI